MNILTLGAVYGLLVLIFQDGRLETLLAFKSQRALDTTAPMLLFAAIFALATDYGVFLLARVKEVFDAGASNDHAVAVGQERTGRAITSAAGLFCVAVGAFATSSLVGVKETSLGLGLAVLIDATLVRALLMPAMMHLLGDWNWWAPRPLRRLHDRIGLNVEPPRTLDMPPLAPKNGQLVVTADVTMAPREPVDRPEIAITPYERHGGRAQ
jgi:RND superfamily putative drug exporter